MSKTKIRSEDILYPERLLSNLINDYVSGKLDDNRVLWRCVVLEVDTTGSLLSTSPPNPKNSIKVRVVSDGYDTLTNDEDLSVLWPLFPHDQMPVKPSEHVYAIFEDDLKTHGLWIARIPEPAANLEQESIDNPNLTPGAKKYKDASEKEVQDLEKDPGVAKQPDDFVVETVPGFRSRVGDRVLEGSNNCLIVIGRDRPSTIDSGYREGAGTTDIVAGRSDSSDMDLTQDKSRIYISAKTDVDDNFEIDVGKNKSAVAAIAVKSDEIRIIGRTGVKIVVEGGDAHIEAQNIFLGKDATESVLQGNIFNRIWMKVLTLVASHTHPAPFAVSPSPTLAELSTPPTKYDLSNEVTGPALSQHVKTKG